LTEKGYNDSSIADIASRAKVYKSLLHYYFKDKERGLGEQSACFSLKYNDSTAKEALSASKAIDELLEATVFFP
jgi:AcrR family transcriptional regulator